MDIFSSVDETILPLSRKLISTGISLTWTGYDSTNYYMRIASRSGLALNSSIDVAAGVVDIDYRGEIFVLLVNNDTANTFQVNKGDKIAQLILEKIVRPNIIEVEQLDETDRGDGGFGSTDEISASGF
jgi:dUTP pyrophosphatase